MLVGESDAGPDYTLEPDLTQNFFGPTQLADVVAKYKSGALVNAVRAAATPSKSPLIPGAPGGFVLVKTNPSTKASGSLPKAGGGNYAVSLYDRSYGSLGNTIYFATTAATQETVPTTGAFTYIPLVGTSNLTVRVNGGTGLAVAVTANMTPPAFVAALGVAGTAASGGALRTVIPSVSGQLSTASPGANGIVVTYTGTWNTTPSVGDTMTIPTGSAIAGAGNANVGAYVVTGATTNTITATKLSDAGKGGAVIGTITAPVVVGATNVLATTDLNGYAPVALTTSGSVNGSAAATNVGTIVDGVGKDLEINDLQTGTDLASRGLFALGTTSPVTWISKTGAPQMLTSAAEYKVKLADNQQSTNVQESVTAGGQLALLLSYTGTTATVTITATALTTSVVGGAGSNLNIDLTKYPTINDLVAFIGAQAGYQAKVGSAASGQTSPLALDEVTAAGICTTYGNLTGRIKGDAVSFFSAVQGGSSLLQVGNPPLGGTATPAPLGLPDVTTSPATVFLTGGTRGATTDAVYDGAVDALKAVQGNFLVPLFSVDGSVAAATGGTDPGSTWTVANVQAYALSHCLAMSTPRRMQHRQCFLTNRSTFVADKAAAQNLASHRASLAIQDMKVTGSNGIVQAHPWMTAVVAAATQAAAFYKSIFNKEINCSGALQGNSTPPDFSAVDPDQVDDALKAGCLIVKKEPDGSFRFASDQTTWSRDNTPYYNSIQQVYVGDIVAVSLSQAVKQGVIGQALADLGADGVAALVDKNMDDYLRDRLLVTSDDAPKGYKNVVVKISGITCKVSLEAKLDNSIYFAPISFLFSLPTQLATG